MKKTRFRKFFESSRTGTHLRAESGECPCIGKKPKSFPERSRIMELWSPCLLLLPLLLRALDATPEPCKLDDEDYRCVCNFTDPEPNWSSAIQCIVAVEVEIRAGTRSLDKFLKLADLDSKQYADTIKGLRMRRLTLGVAQVPARLLFAVLRVLSYTRVKELTLEDLAITGTYPPPPLEATGPPLSTLNLRNVSWATGGAWLAELQHRLNPNLKVLSIAQAQPLAFSCEQLRTFPTLTTLDLSDNPGLGERGLAAVLCPLKFPALQDLRLRDTGMQTLSGVCALLAAAAVQPQRLDLSHNTLSATTNPMAPRCAWPSALSSLNLSFAGLEQVPKGLPARLSALDLSCNRLSRAPGSDELPQVEKLILDGNPFLDSEDPNSQENIMNFSVAGACVLSPLAIGISGTLALLQAGRGFA